MFYKEVGCSVKRYAEHATGVFVSRASNVLVLLVKFCTVDKNYRRSFLMGGMLMKLFPANNGLSFREES